MDINDAAAAVAASDDKPVVVRVEKAFSVYWPGMIAGFAPDQAKTLIARGFAVPVTIGDDGAVIAQEPAAPEQPAPATSPETLSAVEIPANWETLHHFALIKIAKEISGAGRISGKDEAVQIIEDELARRAAAQTKET